METKWHELESDPGLFTLLLEDFGVKGVQVEEVYDLQKHFEGPVFGFIFLFRWIEERRARRKIMAQEEELFVVDDKTVNSIFFAHQLIPDSCATHALLSVLLNTESPEVKLGDTLTKLLGFCGEMSPDDKGFAIGNMPELAKAHNSHARPEPPGKKQQPEKQSGVSSSSAKGEAFHFVSFVPIAGRLYELDGLKPFPICHGEIEPGQDWTDKFKHVIKSRLESEDTRFNLMAVVGDKRQQLEQKLATLTTNRDIIMNALQQLIALMDESKEEGKAEEDPATAEEEEAKEPVYQLRRSGRRQAAEIKRDSSHDEGGEEGVGGLGEGKAEKSSDLPIDVASLSGERLQSVQNKVRISIQVSEGESGAMSKPKTIDSTDYNKPLRITTRFGSSPIASDWSDGTSEVGSVASACSPALSSLSHTTPQTSPVFAPAPQAPVTPGTVKTEAAGKPGGAVAAPGTDAAGGAGAGVETRGKRKRKAVGTGGGDEEKKDAETAKKKRFQCSDLVCLLRKVDDDIARCEQGVRDENEKRRKYQVDDCRRTHPYEQFIVTYLSMLAERNLLPDLVLQTRRVTPPGGHKPKLSKKKK